MFCFRQTLLTRHLPSAREVEDLSSAWHDEADPKHFGDLMLGLAEKMYEGEYMQRGRGVSAWKERDKLSSAFLLYLPGLRSGLSSPFMAEALATLLNLPSRVCGDSLGERVGRTRVDRFGERVILDKLPGGNFTASHNTMELELADLCAECEPYKLGTQGRRAVHRRAAEIPPTTTGRRPTWTTPSGRRS